MKRFLIKALAALLVLATLLPMVVACNDDPPAGGGGEGGAGEGSGSGSGSGGGEGGGEQITHISAVQTGTDEVYILNLNDSETLALSANAPYVNGSKSTVANGSLVWDMSKTSTVAFALPEPVALGVCRYFEFTLYSETATGAKISISLPTTPTSQTVTVNFTGSKTIKIQCESFSVKDPYPPITSVSLSCTPGVGAPGVVTVSSIKATTPKYELQVPNGVDLNDASIYDAITKKYREYIVGSPDGYTSPSYAELVEDIDKLAKQHWELFKATHKDEPGVTFNIPLEGHDSSVGGTVDKCGANIWDYYECIVEMAKGYGTAGSVYYKNPELLADIITALEHGYKYYYGKDLVDGQPTVGNWFEWDIGIPIALIDVLVIIEPDVEVGFLKRMLSPFDKLVPFPMGSGANKTWMTRLSILAGALEHDAMRICTAKDFFNEVFYYVDENPDTYGDGGFYSDGSYVQHSSIAYTGGYGLNLLDELTNLLYFIQDTPFAFSGEHVNNHYEWVFNAFRPVMYGATLFSSLVGRNVHRDIPERHYLSLAVACFVKMYSYAPSEYKSELQSLIRYFMIEADDTFADYVGLPFIDFCASLKSDDSVALPEPYYNTQVFGNMARAVHHGPKYGVCIAMSNLTIHKYEAINGENYTGWYHGDGAIFIYTDDYDFDGKFYLVADPYRIPGVTLNTAGRKPVAITSFPNSSNYAGGATQGRYGAVGYILGYTAATSNTFYNANDSKIGAYKSYFMFDNEIVCVGSSITDKSGKNVITVLENRNWRTDDKLSINGEIQSTVSGTETTVTARTMHFTNMGGYVFLRSGAKNNDGNLIKYRKNNGFFELIFDHGTGNASTGLIANNKYAYSYLPEATAEETETYAADPDAFLISYTDSTHAVLEKKLGIVAANFFEDGTNAAVKVGEQNTQYTALTKIEAETPASVIVSKGENGEYKISVCDPTQLYRTTIVTVTVTGVTQVVSADSGVNAEIDNGTVRITVNTENANGRTFNLTVK